MTTINLRIGAGDARLSIPSMITDEGYELDLNHLDPSHLRSFHSAGSGRC